MECIKRWLKPEKYKQGKCTICNERASIKDIRPIFAKIGVIQAVNGTVRIYIFFK